MTAILEIADSLVPRPAGVGPDDALDAALLPASISTLALRRYYVAINARAHGGGDVIAPLSRHFATARQASTKAESLRKRFPTAGICSVVLSYDLNVPESFALYKKHIEEEARETALAE